MPTAIVTGATGLTGAAIVRHLINDPAYTKIYTLSRSQPGTQHPKIQHAHLDLQDSASSMANSLSGVSADYIYFCAYLAKSDEEEAARVNGALLENFIKALEITGAIKQLKRFILTCGFKHYGVHLGVPKQPLVESDPRLEGGVGGVKWPSNFYYVQQRIVEDAAARGGWEWICTLPNDVIGYAKRNFMNEAASLGLYATVCKTLPGSKLIFPGNKKNYFVYNCWTSAELHARFCLWASTAPGAGNNIFNVANGDTQSFQELWPRLAERFGCKIPENMFSPATTEAYANESTNMDMGTRHPITVHAQKMGISKDHLLTTPPALRLPIDPAKWSQRDDVKEAWKKVQSKYDLDEDAWDKATWDFLTFALGREWGCVGNVNKARKLGWTDYEDTWDSFEHAFRMLEEGGVLPPVEQLKRDYS
ncbi:hypothetical protein SI65_00675 [Aspergillus cristatus]|uniref:PRISE-like Rossmann-fold domain-containing protein n=1 Tax=Aspergillus cristatus TaxID=573508 RepID=A0A1E3BRV5_ASPCR|nr:hypothetical protein SI65_00675 [Aspergillus cristatus]